MFRYAIWICTVIHRDPKRYAPALQLTRRKVIENSADAFPYRSSARHIGKYAGDCKTNTMFDGTDFDGIETEETLNKILLYTDCNRNGENICVGIIGYTGSEDVREVLLDALELLEYRG